MFDPDKVTPKIWNHIIQFLQRTPPPAYHRAAWKDLHQQDLTAVSRVSTMFHELTVPHLYTSVIVNELPLLLEPVPQPLPSLRGRITSKADRLVFIEHLRISALGPAYDTEWRVLDLMEGCDCDWEDITEDDEDRLCRIEMMARQEIHRLKRFLAGIPDGWKPMKRVKSVVIGQAYSKSWQLYEDYDRSIMRYFPGLFDDDARLILSALLTRHLADHFCIYETAGPYGCFFPDTDVQRRPPTTFTVHHVRPDIRPIFLLGANTRHIYNGEDTFVPVQQMGAEQHLTFRDWNHIEGFGRVMRGVPSLTPSQINLLRQTSIDLYGLYSFVSNIGIHGASDTSLDPRKRENEGNIGRAAQFEREMLEYHPADEKVPAIWKGRIRCHPIKDTPCCEACGWNPRTDSFETDLLAMFGISML